MLLTSNCQYLASVTTGDFECDGVGIHDIEGRGLVALGIEGAANATKLPAEIWLSLHSHVLARLGLRVQGAESSPHSQRHTTDRSPLNNV